MKPIYVLALLASLGFAIATFSILSDRNPESERAQGGYQFDTPFESYIAGSGIVEASSGNIAIGTPVSGIVTDIFVKVGDSVEAGAPLFKIDDRSPQAQLVTANARVNEAAASLLMPRHRLEHAEQLIQRDPTAISPQVLGDLRDEVAQAEAALELARAQVRQLQMEIEQHTVRALVAGEILQLRMRLGEFVEGTSLAQPLLLLGSMEKKYVRVDIDENDAWRFKPGADAVAVARGRPQVKMPLQFEFTEPYVIPKYALTGQSTERTDSRVLQVLYSFVQDGLPVFAGQQLDVYIQAPSDVRP